MNTLSRSVSTIRQYLVALLTFALLATAAVGQQGAATTNTTAPAVATSTLTAVEREAAALLKVETLREVTTALAAQDMLGRGTAQPGGDMAARYIAAQMKTMGLKPLGDAGTYLQAVPFRSEQVAPESVVKVGDASLKFGEDYIVAPPFPPEKASSEGELVFVGYGVTSAELKRDDLAGMDVKGKIVVMLNGHPSNVDAEQWKQEVNPQRVGIGLIQRGAAGFIILNYGSKQYSFAQIANYLTRRRVSLATAPQMSLKLPPTVLLSDGAAEKIFAGSGATYAEMRAKAESGEFASRSLNKQATMSIEIKREQATGSNVVGVLEGSDARLKDEAVVYTAHYDAFGTEGGRIYPGAADNALGVGEILSIAEALTRMPQRPKRSVIILAVTGEEYGLLGAKYWTEHPTWPLAKVVADLNFDGIGTEVYAPVKRVVGFGAEYSDLGAVLEGVASATGVQLIPDPLPEEGAFYRSDHYAFVQKGVPALMLLGGPEGETSVWIARAKKWMETDYHQPGDIVRPDWNWDGARTIALIGLITGLRIANAEAIPQWLPSAPFKRPS